VLYAFAVMSKLLGDADLLEDARAASALISDDVIAEDRQLDVVSGCAGAILTLLKLHRDTGWQDALKAAVRCGEHLMATERIGADGQRSWRGAHPYLLGMTGMSHGAAGFGYALTQLAAVTGQAAFAEAAMECFAFASGHLGEEMRPRSQWCHGAAGVGLARLGVAKFGSVPVTAVADDVDAALDGAALIWPGHVDTLCCGSLGVVELLAEASTVLRRAELAQSGSRRLSAVLNTKTSAGDYRWNTGSSRFNMGLFRGLAGVGYTLLRRVDGSLPNVLIWE
jgi:lantibiotic modifying enzyme